MLSFLIEVAENLITPRAVALLAVGIVLLLVMWVYKKGNERVKRAILLAEVWAGLILAACSVVYLIFW
jgi:hypothetical protein